ncbi:MAG: hypothetical protein H7240_00770 [Glaciimonas sp.]|nr:hypothetical protein [Glaciimonas sp.]
MRFVTIAMTQFLAFRIYQIALGNISLAHQVFMSDDKRSVMQIGSKSAAIIPKIFLRCNLQGRWKTMLQTRHCLPITNIILYTVNNERLSVGDDGSTCLAKESY